MNFPTPYDRNEILLSNIKLISTDAANADAVSGNGSSSAWVSSVNTVSVRFANNDLTNAIDPASGTFRVSIIKY